MVSFVLSSLLIIIGLATVASIYNYNRTPGSSKFVVVTAAIINILMAVGCIYLAAV